MQTSKAEHPRWFEDAVFPYEEMLRGWLARRFPGLRDREDLIQDAYLRILEAHRRDPLTNPKAFLFATARNLALDQVRRERVLPMGPLLSVEAEALGDGSDLPAELARNQELEILAEAIESLPARCRMIFVLRKVYGLSQKDIAVRLGLSENTISAQLTIGFGKCAEFVRARASEGRPRHG